MRRYEKPGRVTIDLACAAFAFIYIGLFASLLVQLRFIGGATFGLFGLLTLIVVVKMGDIGAYTVGRLIGRHKMAPVLSPGKTWEGAVGAVAFATFGAWLSFTQLGPLLKGSDYAAWPNEPWIWKSYGIFIGVAGILGDLGESLLKRDLGVKDSSRWMPGFGGVLDILDSLLLAAPLGYLFWLALASLWGPL
jgi:phosphatidate cytidylyltransferase